MKVIGKTIFAVSLLLLASGCKSSMVEKIAITPASLTVIKGEKTEFNVYITPSDPDKKSISCKISDENIGKTSGILSYYVKGIDVGSAVVTCSDKYSGVVSNEMVVNVVLSEEEKNKGIIRRPENEQTGKKNERRVYLAAVDVCLRHSDRSLFSHGIF